MTGTCVYCETPTDHEWFGMTVCPDCERTQRDALSRIAKLVHPLSWNPPPDAEDE